MRILSSSIRLLSKIARLWFIPASLLLVMVALFTAKPAEAG